MEPLLTYREVARYLRSLGAEHLRTVGTHEQWRLPNGHRVTVPVPAGKAGQKAWTWWRSRKRWDELTAALKRQPGEAWSSRGK